MDWAANDLAERDLYKLLVNTVLPRPIALVTTVDAQGRANAAPFSFFNVFSHAPPLVVLGIEGRSGGAPLKDTMRNIRETGSFVVNLVDRAMVERTIQAQRVVIEPGDAVLLFTGYQDRRAENGNDFPAVAAGLDGSTVPLWRDLDILEPRVAQDSPHPLRVREGEGTRRARLRRGRRWKVGRRGDHRGQHPGIFRQRTPADEGQPPTRLQPLADIREGRRRVGEEHHPEAGKGRVQRAGRERMGLGVGLHEARLRDLRAAPAGFLQHRPGDVDASDRPGLAHSRGERQGGPAAPAADVDEPLSRLGVQRRHGRHADAFQLSVEEVGKLGPGPARGVVPIGDLVGVGAGVGLAHAAKLALAAATVKIYLNAPQTGQNKSRTLE